jgi:ABC-type transport system involved in multi-copper enzyme maturation permease subunit
MERLFVVALTECLKIRRSKVFIISMIAISMMPLICALFMLLSMHPEIALKSGLITQKAKLFAATDGASYLSLISKMISVGGVIIIGFVTSWIFGREYSDSTAKDLLALPIPRSMVVLGKFIAVFLWSVLLAALAFSLAICFGLLIGTPGFDSRLLLSNLDTYAIATLMVIILSTPIAFFACWGRGYLPPLCFLIFVLFLGNVIGSLGHGAYFPWIIPALYAGLAGAVTLSPASFIIVAATGLAGAMATIAWWRYVDQK